MRQRLVAYLQLIRLPAVFTPMADIVLGSMADDTIHFRSDDSLTWHPTVEFALLLVASCCLYLSGMVLNDVFDRKQDAQERPGRPIPSGRVPLGAAIALGIALMLSGVAMATCVSRGALLVSLVLSGAILAYDSFLKRTWLGPVAMGSCRFLNVLLGGSAFAYDFSDVLTQPRLLIAFGLGIYIVGVTIFARTEAQVSSRRQLVFAMLVLNAGLVLLSMVMLKYQFVHRAIAEDVETTSIPMAMGILLAIAFTINRRALFALYDPKPITVQTCIKVMLLSYVMLDATMVYWFANGTTIGHYGTMVAMATAALVLPAMLLGRFIPMT